MIPFTSILGLSLCALAAVAIAMHVMNIVRFTPGVRWAVLAMLAMLLLVPVDGLIVAAYVRGIIGDPSIVTAVIMVVVCVKQLTRVDLFDERNIASLMVLVLVGGCVLYPLALGLTMYDPYALGYGSRGFFVTLLVMALAAWWLELHLVVICIVAAVTAYTLELLESRNLWDYLVDPIAVAIAIGWAVKNTFLRLRHVLDSQRAST